MHSCLKRPDLIFTGNCQQIVDGAYVDPRMGWRFAIMMVKLGITYLDVTRIGML